MRLVLLMILFLLFITCISALTNDEKISLVMTVGELATMDDEVCYMSKQVYLSKLPGMLEAFENLAETAIVFDIVQTHLEEFEETQDTYYMDKVRSIWCPCQDDDVKYMVGIKLSEINGRLDGYPKNDLETRVRFYASKQIVTEHYSLKILSKYPGPNEMNTIDDNDESDE